MLLPARRAAGILGVLIAASASTDPGLAGQEAGDPLDAFGELVVGTWEGPGSRHVLEWGVARQAIRSRSYFQEGTTWTLVSEGMWYWHPSSGSIRGVVVATSMPVTLLEYVSEVTGTTVVHQMTGHGEGGGPFRETWHVGPDGYTWTLEQPEGNGFARVMGGSYDRVP